VPKTFGLTLCRGTPFTKPARSGFGRDAKEGAVRILRDRSAPASERTRITGGYYAAIVKTDEVVGATGSTEKSSPSPTSSRRCPQNDGLPNVARAAVVNVLEGSIRPTGSIVLGHVPFIDDPGLGTVNVCEALASAEF